MSSLSHSSSSREIVGHDEVSGRPSQSGQAPRNATADVRQPREQIDLRGRVRQTPVAWQCHVGLTREEWQAYGSRIGLASKSTNWWLGDWMRFGERYQDQRYHHAAELTGYEEQTLMNLAYVAGRFVTSRRREILSWSHHAELAALDTTDQDFWLDQAAIRHLSVRELRVGLRGPRAPAPRDRAKSARAASGSSYSPRSPSPDVRLVCPTCGRPLADQLNTVAT